MQQPEALFYIVPLPYHEPLLASHNTLSSAMNYVSEDMKQCDSDTLPKILFHFRHNLT